MQLTLRDKSNITINIESSPVDILAIKNIAKSHSFSNSANEEIMFVDNAYLVIAEYVESIRKSK